MRFLVLIFGNVFSNVLLSPRDHENPLEWQRSTSIRFAHAGDAMLFAALLHAF